MSKEREVYERVEEDLSELDEEIARDNDGVSYDDLSKADQRQILLDRYFNGNPQYENSAERMRRGIDMYRSGEGETGESAGIWGEIHRRGKVYHVVRGADGRIRQWLRE